MEIGIIGLGLMGGSLAKAIKEKFNSNIIAYNYTEPELIISKKDLITKEYTFGEFENSNLKLFSNCDIVFFSTPINMIANHIKILLPYLKNNCIISDLGSTKNSILKEMEKLKNVNYIGGHPMTGSEKTGYINSTSYLFENAYYILSPSCNSNDTSLNILKNIVKKIGGIPLVMNSSVHDKAVSGISHSPHIIASCLVNTVKDMDNDNHMHTLAAGGFKDITRIASSNPNIWSAISIDNKDEIINFLLAYQNNLENIINSLKNSENDEIFDFFENSRNYRNSFESIKNTYSKIYKINVDMEDKTGMIATVGTILSFNDINIKNIGIKNSREYENGVLEIHLENEFDKEKSIKILKNMNFSVYK